MVKLYHSVGTVGPDASWIQPAREANNLPGFLGVIREASNHPDMGYSKRLLDGETRPKMFSEPASSISSIRETAPSGCFEAEGKGTTTHRDIEVANLEWPALIPMQLARVGRWKCES